ncbi:MAG: DUF2829 domain-containing protein [Candidatus Moranbacteria bacterium]|nr:DUF2829 domain-containing protein [Candidatus Moranbacteria bacterium]
MEDKAREFDFGTAVEFARQGYKISRRGWNGKGQWVSFAPGKELDLTKHDIWTENIKEVAQQNGGKVKIRDYMNLKTVNNEIQIGWTPSISDALAKDWYIV